jgi:hypothetical protein
VSGAEVECVCGRCGALVAVARDLDDGGLGVFPVARRGRKRLGEGASFDGLTPRPLIRMQRNRYGRGGRPVATRLMDAVHPLGADDVLVPACGCPGPAIPARTVRRRAERARARGERGCTIPRR